jgi:hypothetical protein
MLHFNVYRFEKSRQTENEKKKRDENSAQPTFRLYHKHPLCRGFGSVRENQLKKFNPVTDGPLGRNVIST